MNHFEFSERGGVGEVGALADVALGQPVPAAADLNAACSQYEFYCICARVHDMEVVLHPLFETWLTSLTDGSLVGGVDWWEVAAEIAAA